MPLIKHCKVTGKCWTTAKMESVWMVDKVRMNEYGGMYRAFNGLDYCASLVETSLSRKH